MLAFCQVNVLNEYDDDDDDEPGKRQKAKRSAAADKTFFGFTWRVVLADFLLEGHTENKQYYQALLSD